MGDSDLEEKQNNDIYGPVQSMKVGPVGDSRNRLRIPEWLSPEDPTIYQLMTPFEEEKDRT